MFSILLPQKKVLRRYVLKYFFRVRGDSGGLPYLPGAHQQLQRRVPQGPRHHQGAQGHDRQCAEGRGPAPLRKMPARQHSRARRPSDKVKKKVWIRFSFIIDSFELFLMKAAFKRKLSEMYKHLDSQLQFLPDIKL